MLRQKQIPKSWNNLKTKNLALRKRRELRSRYPTGPAANPQGSTRSLFSREECLYNPKKGYFPPSPVRHFWIENMHDNSKPSKYVGRKYFGTFKIKNAIHSILQRDDIQLALICHPIDHTLSPLSTCSEVIFKEAAKNNRTQATTLFSLVFVHLPTFNYIEYETLPIRTMKALPPQTPFQKTPSKKPT